MAHIAFLVDNHFEQVELTGPWDQLRAKGHRTTLIATQQKELQGLNHVDMGDRFHADLLLSEASVADFDALVLPGGTVNSDAVRANPEVLAFVKKFATLPKPIAAICHAPWVLVSSGLARGKTLTAYHTIKDDLQNAGAIYTDQAVCIDHYLITSRCPDDIDAFSAAIDDMLTGAAPVDDSILN